MRLFHRYELATLPPLHRAASAGDIAALILLLDAGSDVNAVHDLDDAQYAAHRGALTPLMVAAGAENSSAACVAYLLGHGADPRRTSAAGVDALWYATASGDPARVALLLQSGDLHAAANGQTAVSVAARNGSSACLRLLLQAGASPHAFAGPGSAADVHGMAIPLFAAAAAGSTSCVQMLLDLGADPYGHDADGCTALMYASSADVCRLLVASGCPVNKHNALGTTALMRMVQRHHVAAVVQRDYPQIGDSRELAPYVTQRQIDIIGAVLDAGADPEARDAEGRTALLLACRTYDTEPELISFLLVQGADSQARDVEGRTALHYAALSSNRLPVLEVVMAHLVRAGLAVDVCDSHNRTPLHLAAEKEQSDYGAIASLLALGAPVDARDADGASPLILAARMPDQRFGIVRTLLAAGANRAASTYAGVTAGMAAAARVAVLRETSTLPANDLDLTHLGVPPVPIDPAQAAYHAATQRIALRSAGATLQLLDEKRSTMVVNEPPRSLSEPVWLGYRAVRPMASPADWRENPGVDHIEQICSVSHAATFGAMNAANCFPTLEALAEERARWSTLANGSPESVQFYHEVWGDPEHSTPEEIHAYRAYPLRFGDSGQPQSIAADMLMSNDVAKPVPADLRRAIRLGYDIQECTGTTHYRLGCTPLSPYCNGMAVEFGALINGWCLVDDLETAYDLALMFGISQPEPGPYVVIEVWRMCRDEV